VSQAKPALVNPRVTVLTTVYNGLPYLREAIESTLNQSYRDFEYLIIDDASTDESVECILTYEDPRIRLVRNQKNLGTANTINKALALITTPYVLRLDQDDVSLPNRIEEQIDYLDKHPDIAIVCSWEHTIDSDGTRLRDWKRTIENYGEFLAPILLGLCPIWHPSIAFRKDAMIAVGGFDAEYTRAEDFDVTARMALARLGAAVVPRFHLLQRRHIGQQSNEYENRMAGIGRRVHMEALQRFSSSPYLESLAYFLRLEPDPTGLRKRKDYLRIIQRTLRELIQAVAGMQRLSAEELTSLKRLIYRRVGPGIRFAPVLSRLPAFVFYLTSPMHLHNVRGRLSRVYTRLLAFRYTYRRY
jgi:glycosyltransferase involved in cell wall biosynthesis